ncbi:hypothetical protein C4J81_16335 [Deltaproteobacteria bacterium Smac51]|nr:hypothetical protein C4J81_16335 [Deltaproteobacteria bacterium Smac51]
MNIINKPGGMLQINQGGKHHNCDCLPEEGANICECPEGGIPGPAGPQGPKGDKGDKGDSGGGLIDIHPEGVEVATGRFDRSETDGVVRPTYLKSIKLAVASGTTKLHDISTMIPNFRRSVPSFMEFAVVLWSNDDSRAYCTYTNPIYENSACSYFWQKGRKEVVVMSGKAQTAIPYIMLTLEYTKD